METDTSRATLGGRGSTIFGMLGVETDSSRVTLAEVGRTLSEMLGVESESFYTTLFGVITWDMIAGTELVITRAPKGYVIAYSRGHLIAYSI